jgi:hypothetical protein
MADFGLKNGQNQEFSVTDSLTVRKYKLFILWKLQAMDGPKRGFPQGRGWGYPKTGIREQGTGIRKGAAVAGVHALIVHRRRLILCNGRRNHLRFPRAEKPD